MQHNPGIKAKLEKYSAIILKWNKKINLISRSTEKEIWERHIADSVQLAKFITNEDIIYDLGSGAGFPGIVVAAVSNAKTYLIESDVRKATFLNFIISELGISACVINDRIEAADFGHLPKATKITARALASINILLGFYEIIKPIKSMILLKGKTFQKELDEAEKKWHFDYEIFQSETSKESVVIEIKNVRTKA